MLCPVSGHLPSSTHKILIFSTGARNGPMQEYHALNALMSGRSDLIAPYLTFDEIQEIYGDGDFASGLLKVIKLFPEVAYILLLILNT